MATLVSTTLFLCYRLHGIIVHTTLTDHIFHLRYLQYSPSLITLQSAVQSLPHYTILCSIVPHYTTLQYSPSLHEWCVCLISCSYSLAHSSHAVCFCSKGKGEPPHCSDSGTPPCIIEVAKIACYEAHNTLPSSHLMLSYTVFHCCAMSFTH